MAIPKESRDKYVYLKKKITYQLWKAGVPLMAGSDSPEFFLVAGFSLHDELAAFVASCLSSYAALQTATANPAAFLGLKEKGTIKAGNDADLILLDNNPLKNINNSKAINCVFKNGILFNQTSLNEMLNTAKGLGK